jgi:beta-ketoacyl-acyl-carrier-protein synthase II
MNASRPRAVITGLGAITPLGLSVKLFWDGLVAGRSGIARITQFDASALPCQIAGEVKGFEAKNYMDFKEARRVSRSSQFALAAAKEAMADAGFSGGFSNPERVSVVLATAIGGLDKTDEGISSLRARGWEKTNPFITPNSLCNMPGHHVSRTYQALGSLSTIVTACAAGTQAVGEAAELIRRGAADVVITGGVDAAIQDFAIGGFCTMRALPTNYNDRPEKASRPFSKDREGFVYSEGCAILIVERLEHAQQRGARIYAEVIGHSASSDAYDVVQPDPSGAGAMRAMRWALQDAGLSADDVDYINAHGTSTPVGDVAETSGIKAVFGPRASAVPINSTKSMIGHAMGAAGALEAIVCAKTLHTGTIHPTINYEVPDPECDLDYVPNAARQTPVQVALSNSFGLGGQNACLILKKLEA